MDDRTPRHVLEKRKKPNGVKYWYDKVIWTPDHREPKWVRSAYTSWMCQKSRCECKKTPYYKNYGGRGIVVKYSSREFVGWWREQMKTFFGKNPTIDRIDNDGNYEFGNIQILSKSENTKKRLRERGNPTASKRVLILDYPTMEPLLIAKSVADAGRWTGVARANVGSILRGSHGKWRSLSGKGYTFSYCAYGLK